MAETTKAAWTGRRAASAGLADSLPQAGGCARCHAATWLPDCGRRMQGVSDSSADEPLTRTRCHGAAAAKFQLGGERQAAWAGARRAQCAY
jgi:hypothetical protein